MSACSSGTLTSVLPHRDCHVADTGHGTSPRHSIQTRDRSVDVLSIDVKRHIGIHNYPFYCIGSDPIGKSFPDLPHTPMDAQLYYFLYGCI